MRFSVSDPLVLRRSSCLIRGRKPSETFAFTKGRISFQDSCSNLICISTWRRNVQNWKRSRRLEVFAESENLRELLPGARIPSRTRTKSARTGTIDLIDLRPLPAANRKWFRFKISPWRNRCKTVAPTWNVRGRVTGSRLLRFCWCKPDKLWERRSALHCQLCFRSKSGVRSSAKRQRKSFWRFHRGNRDFEFPFPFVTLTLVCKSASSSGIL